MTKDGKPAPGNPFIDQKDAMPQVYAYGIRNCQSLDIHPVTGELWEAEFGPRGGDEVNIIHAGKNYGWPTITYGIEYSGEKVGDGIQQKDGLEQPVYYWDPVIAPSGMAFYTGDAFPGWKGSILIGSLNPGLLVRLTLNDDKVVHEERYLGDLRERIREVQQGGAPMSGAHDIQIALWNHANSTSLANRVCAVGPVNTVITSGRFQIPLDNVCTTAVRQNALVSA